MIVEFHSNPEAVETGVTVAWNSAPRVLILPMLIAVATSLGLQKEIKKKIPIIGVGGIDSGKSAFEKVIAGASAVQLYTGMVYKGPGIVKEIKKELISILKKENLKNVSEAVGINA